MARMRGELVHLAAAVVSGKAQLLLCLISGRRGSTALPEVEGI
ncbi:MAG TPA: hypothetical protein VGO67_16670 [Verrucomicrobiae bacterium]